MTTNTRYFKTDADALQAANRLISELLSYDPDCRPSVGVHPIRDDADTGYLVAVDYDAVVDGDDPGERALMRETVGYVLD